MCIPDVEMPLVVQQYDIIPTTYTRLRKRSDYISEPILLLDKFRLLIVSFNRGKCASFPTFETEMIDFVVVEDGSRKIMRTAAVRVARKV